MVGVFVPRLFPVAEDLPEDDAIAPDVRLDCECAVEDALRWHPTHGQHGRVTADLQDETVREGCVAGSGILVLQIGGRWASKIGGRWEIGR